MAQITQLKDSQQQQQRLAILALLADRPQPASQCLDNETLAALVEGKLDQSTTNICLEHLADCEDCLSFWISLNTSWKKKHTPGKIGTITQFLSRPKILATTGSLLALAASVTVFLQITMQPAPNFIPLRNESQPQGEDLLPPAPDAVPLNTTPSRPRAKAQASTTIAQEASPQEGDTVSEMTLEQEFIAPLPSRRVPREAQQRSFNTFATPQRKKQSPPSAPVPLTTAHWENMIREGCSQEPDDQFFLKIFRFGQSLLQLQGEAPLSPADKLIIERILQILHTTQAQSAQQRCVALLQIVKKS